MNMTVMLSHERLKKFPNSPKSVPFSLLDEQWALKVHGQTLKRLNERGGMSVEEIVGNIGKLDWITISRIPFEKALVYLENKIKIHERTI